MLFAFLKFLWGLIFFLFFSNLAYAANKGQLYYFISFSMSDSLIKNYLQEAALNKGILVLRGISPGMNLHDFLLQKLLPLLQDPENSQAAYGNIEINPNLFKQYTITQVPTLVYVMDEKHYWKVSGPVTGVWAVDLFKSAPKPMTKFSQP